MPLGCSVKGCPGKRTGYTNTITSVHKFPLRNPELVKIWLEKLGKE
jgi:THAP domain